MNLEQSFFRNCLTSNNFFIGFWAWFWEWPEPLTGPVFDVSWLGETVFLSWAFVDNVVNTTTHTSAVNSFVAH